MKEWVRRNVVTVRSEAPIHEVANELKEHGVGSVVVEEANRPVGIITDRDLVVRVMADKDRDESAMTAGDVMSENLVTVDIEGEFSDVLDAMHDNGIRRIPLVDDGELLTGIITLDDFMVIHAAELQSISKVIEGEFPSPIL